MKIAATLLFIFLVVLNASAQRYAPNGSGGLVYLGHSINKTWSAGVGYVWRYKNTVYTGYSSQFNSNERHYVFDASNRNNINAIVLNDFLDLGYEYMFNKKASFGIECSYGSENFYSQSNAPKKKKDSYGKNNIWGLGLFGTYYLNDVIGISVGYNTLKSAFATFSSKNS